MPPIKIEVKKEQQTQTQAQAQAQTTCKQHHELQEEKAKIQAINLSAYYGDKQALKNINLVFPENKITAIIGPSGCGKSTLLRTINRLHELRPNTRIQGQVLFNGINIYHEKINPVMIRRKIGMVFQKPNPFPHMSIYDNVIAGLKIQGKKKKQALDKTVQESLSIVGLWEEVKDELGKRGTELSGGQQQRLCIARTIAVQPEVILMDEPTASLDPTATLKIEDLMKELKKKYTIIVVTHNMQQAARVSDYTAFLYNGKLIEHGKTRQIFENPREKLTYQYITGRFG